MRILRIAGANLASLADPFEVDFESGPLATAGLFAISGPTGAGKSTLLDALCLALYDATPRLARATRSAGTLPDVGEDLVSPNDPRTLLRRGAAEGYAEVDFVGTDGLRYRARWSVRRARSKATGSLQKSALSLHRLPDMLPIGGTKKTEVAADIASRVGLSFDQFTRAVLLAQNEFSAFLKADENERGELLETLTGSDIYSGLSRRAFERHKAEQARTQQLAERLAGQAPLAAPQRAELEEALRAANEALAGAQAGREALECQWRWFDEESKLARHAGQAREALEAALARQHQAEPRRRQLATVEAVQAARPLAVEASRLAAARTTLEAVRGAAQQAYTAAQAASQRTQEALGAAQAGLERAEQAQREAAPLLDAAKALDSRIAALAPGHQAAAEVRDAASVQAAQASQSFESVQREHGEVTTALSHTTQWLSAERDTEALATQWPRWERLLQRAATLSGELAGLAQSEQQAAAAAESTAKALQQAQESLAAGAQRLTALGEARQQAMGAAAAFDLGDMRAVREATDARRSALAIAEKRWQDLASVLAALGAAREKRLAASATLDDTATRLQRAADASGALQAALAQAQASHDAAQAACAASVEALRATLGDGVPCPVCGSEEHPYHQQDDRLRAMLDSLAQQVKQCRANVQENVALQASLTATVAHATSALAALDSQLATLDESHNQARQAWEAEPLSAQEGIDAAWFAREQDALAGQAAALSAQEELAAQALAARDRAQAAYDQAHTDHAALQSAATTAAANAASAVAAHQAVAEKRMAAGATLDAVLQELDPPMIHDGWRSRWQPDPEGFARECAARAAHWNSQLAGRDRLAARSTALDASLAAAAARHAAATTALAAAKTAFEQADAGLVALRQQRATLLDGRATGEVEQALSARVAQCREQLAGVARASQEAAHEEVRLRETRDQAGRQLAANADQQAAAARALDDWLAGYAVSHPGLDPVGNTVALGELLARPDTWIAAEREAMGSLDAAVATASAVLAERSAQLDQHQLARPAGAADAGAVRSALDEALAGHEARNNAMLALRLQLAQDDARREQSTSVLAQLEAQQEVERRWGRLNELIGSADGKKFRNYAQQFTLDVLLGYANQHLEQLARRYRLERVATASGPSLGLLVRDQDMGGEVRSANSLSGGESFLVSLALALGLASLSSNRVRVESLFIDEGFGSLDSETLRVAMDALDALQSMGRKVGVISHVQEMAERIATRIVVSPVGAGLSRVSVP